MSIAVRAGLFWSPAISKGSLRTASDNKRIALEFSNDSIALDGAQIEREWDVLNEQDQSGECNEHRHQAQLHSTSF